MTKWNAKQLRTFAAFGFDLRAADIWGYADYAACHTDAQDTEESYLDTLGLDRIYSRDDQPSIVNGRRIVAITVSGHTFISIVGAA